MCGLGQRAGAAVKATQASTAAPVANTQGAGSGATGVGAKRKTMRGGASRSAYGSLLERKP